MPDINAPTGPGRSRKLVEIEPGVFAPVVAMVAHGGAGIITDNTGRYRFDVNSLASRLTYDGEGNQTSITYGPDLEGRYIRQTSQWLPGNLLESDSDWQLVNADGDPVDGEGKPL